MDYNQIMKILAVILMIVEVKALAFLIWSWCDAKKRMMKIEDLNFTVRTYNCLKRKKIDTVDQLARMTDDDLLNIRGFGVLCLKEVHEKLGGKYETDTPAVPGPSDDDPNIMEVCFHNGEQHMKAKVISCLMEHKTQVKGACHAHVVEIIKMVEGL